MRTDKQRFKHSVVSRAVIAALWGTGAMLVAQDTLAQQSSLERVEITGSAIKRVDAETALPVIMLQRADIEKSGATSITDLMQKLPAIQGSVTESNAVGGETFGFAGISIHNLTEQRTLVLLNGHRLALFGGQQLTGFAAGFDLNSLPIAAIERVELLTDGASALYGSDAIAGVVNFITRRSSTEGDLTLGYSAPKAGAKEKRFSLTKGFGDVDKQGFNVLLSYAHDERTKLNSTDRDFGNTGRVFFSQNGKNYRFQQYSASPIPANVVDDNGNLISPWLKTHGSCPERTFRVTDGGDDFCGFDFVSQLEIYPVRKRDSLFGSATMNLKGGHQAYADLLVSKNSETDRIAPVPGSVSIPAGTPLFDTYLAPLGITQDTIAFYRIFDLGKRTNFNTSKFLDFSLGVKGTISTIDYDTFYTHSRSQADSSLSGYPGALAVSRVRKSGLLNPFVLAGEQTPAAQAALDSINYKGPWNGGTSNLDTFNVRGSTELMKLPAGPMALGAGLSYNKEKFETRPSLFAQAKLHDPVAGTLCDPANPALACDQRFGDSAALPAYSASRNFWGLFGELQLPATKNLEFTLSARHDKYSDFGGANTGKAAFRWKLTPDVLVRGSVGTGFHAPTVPQVAAAPQSFGVTSDKYTCTPGLAAVAAANGAECRPGSQQYDVIAAGNPLLKPERSKQATIGFRVEPASWISAGADLWFVGIKDVFGQLPENAVFLNPTAYPGSWRAASVDVGTGKTYLAFNQGNLNLGKQYSTGIDFDVSGRAKTPIGQLDVKFNATYMIREVAQQVTDGPYYSQVGDFGDNVGGVTFRYQGRIITSLKTGKFTNTLGFNFKSGYMDQTQTVDVLDAAGNVTGTEDVRVKVPRYYTFDWQTQYDFNKTFSFTVGALNVFNKKPPFAISTGGINRGQQFGYDDRYYDPRGRTLYVNGTMHF